MWFYLKHFTIFYFCLYGGQAGSSSSIPSPTSHTFAYPQDLWTEICEVTHDYIDASSRDKTPDSLFHPTSFLNPGYGVLFQHIGQLHQSVYKHYLVVALKIPHIHNMPQGPEEWYKGCEEGLPLLKKYYEDQTFQTIFNEDYCAKDRIQTLYIELTQLLHSTLPALLPNQVLPYADYHFFNKTPEELPTNSYGSTASKRVQRSALEPLEKIPLVEIQCALDYVSKYGEPLPLDEDTIYADQLSSPTASKRQKRFLGAIVKGLGKIFKGANIFGKIINGVKKIGGFFKGIKGLFHRHKNTALTQAVRAFQAGPKQFLLDKLYKFHRFKGLHLGKSSLVTTICHTWHKAKFWACSKFTGKFNATIYDAFNTLHQDAYIDSRRALNGPFTGRYSKLNFGDFFHAHTHSLNKYVQQMDSSEEETQSYVTTAGAMSLMFTDTRIRNLFNYTNHMLSFLNYRRESVSYLEKMTMSLHTLVYGLEQLAAGKLSHTLLPPNVLHKYLEKALGEVRIHHPQFVPLYTELHHYYESDMNSYTNDETHIYLQIPVFFTARNQPPLDLYRLHMVPVPLDWDTYAGRESKYTSIALEYPYLATNGEEYMDITDATLDSCEVYHMDYLCENIHLTTDIKELTCAISIYMDTIETSRWSPAELNTLIQSRCNITYHKVLYPSPTTLQTQDEILLANFRTHNWQLLCDEISDRPIPFQGALYTVITLDDLCTCAIITPSGCYLYESMHSCDHPDNNLTLYFTYNRPLISYDKAIDPKTAKQYSKTPYPFRAPDLVYQHHEPYITPKGSLHTRVK